MVVKFRMLKRRQYPDKTTGELKVAHNLEATVDDEGTGDFYIQKEVYEAIKAEDFEDGQPIRLLFGARVFRGNATTFVAGAEPL